MTDDRPPIDASDEELVSAYLDGEATSDERARVEADPRLLALVESYRAAAQAVGSPVMPLDQPRRDAMVIAALAVLDDPSDTDVAPANVVKLSGRRRWLSRAPGLAAAAAILFLVGMGLVLSSRGSGRDQQADVSASAEQSTSADDLASKSAEDGDAGSLEAGDASGPDAEALESAPSDPVTDLGAFTDEASLRRALAVDPAAPTPSAQEGEPGPGATAEQPDRASPKASNTARCATVVTTTDPLLGDLIAVRTATLAGEPVLIFSHTERDEPDRIIDTVTDRGSCQIRFAQAR